MLCTKVLIPTPRPATMLSALGLQVPRAGGRAGAATAEASTGVSTAEVAKLFGRFAENVLHLDRDVGACAPAATASGARRTAAIAGT